MSALEKVNVSKIKANLLQPALTSHFIVDIPKPKYGTSDGGFAKYLSDNGVKYNEEKLRLLCSEATLPGSSIATHENNTDFTGVTEKFAYRRVYDDRIDLTFYVDAENYLPIRFFEAWIKYIVGESISPGTGRLPSSYPNYFYRVKYPVYYIAEKGLTITKFERTSKSEKSKNHEGNALIYNFVNAFPLSITSMPVSYEASSLLKCTVSFSYIRYYVGSKDFSSTPESSSGSSKGAADGPQALTGAGGLTGAQLDAIDAQDILNTEALALQNAQFGTSSTIPPIF
jgi:hypothetical protein